MRIVRHVGQKPGGRQSILEKGRGLNRLLEHIISFRMLVAAVLLTPCIGAVAANGPVRIPARDPFQVIQGHLELRALVDELKEDGSTKNWAVLIPDGPVILEADDSSEESRPERIICLVAGEKLEILNCGLTTVERGFYPLYKKYLGRRIKVRGEYYHRDNGHQPTNVLVFARWMEVLDCPDANAPVPTPTLTPGPIVGRWPLVPGGPKVKLRSKLSEESKWIDDLALPLRLAKAGRILAADAHGIAGTLDRGLAYIALGQQEQAYITLSGVLRAHPERWDVVDLIQERLPFFVPAVDRCLGQQTTEFEIQDKVFGPVRKITQWRQPVNFNHDQLTPDSKELCFVAVFGRNGRLSSMSHFKGKLELEHDTQGRIVSFTRTEAGIMGGQHYVVSYGPLDRLDAVDFDYNGENPKKEDPGTFTFRGNRRESCSHTPWDGRWENKFNSDGTLAESLQGSQDIKYEYSLGGCRIEYQDVAASPGLAMRSRTDIQLDSWGNREAWVDYMWKNGKWVPSWLYKREYEYGDDELMQRSMP